MIYQKQFCSAVSKDVVKTFSSFSRFINELNGLEIVSQGFLFLC